MKKFSLIAFTMLATGCATIFNGGSKAVTIDSSAPSSNFTVTNSEGRLVHSGITPQRVVLNNGAGYFSKEHYTVKMGKKGFEDTTGQLDPSISAWYWGNILLGGAIGMAVVDPITGAMYKLPDQYTVPMRKLEPSEMAANSTDSMNDEGAAKPAVYGKWQFQAERLAQATSCSQPIFVNSGPGVELYTSSCNKNPASIRCEFGQCSVQ